MFSLLKRGAPTRRPCLWSFRFPESTPGEGNRSGRRAFAIRTALTVGRPEAKVAESAVGGVQKCFPRPDGDPITPPVPPGERVRADRWGFGPGVSEAEAAPGLQPMPTPARKGGGPRQPISPLTRTPPAAAARKALMAQPGAGHMGAGHALPGTAHGAD